MTLILSAGAPVRAATNYVPTPRFGRGVGQWDAPALAFPGVFQGALQVSYADSVPAGNIASTTFPVVVPASGSLFVRARVRTPQAARQTRLTVDFIGIDGTVRATRTTTSSTTSAWTSLAGPHTGATVNTTQVRLSFAVLNAASGSWEQLLIDEVYANHVVTGQPSQAFFDGDTPSTAQDTYTWDGTPGASASVKLSRQGAAVAAFVTDLTHDRTRSVVTHRPLTAPPTIGQPYGPGAGTEETGRMSIIATPAEMQTIIALLPSLYLQDTDDPSRDRRMYVTRDTTVALPDTPDYRRLDLDYIKEGS